MGMTPRQRRFATIVAVPAMLLLAIAVVVYFFDWNWLKHPIERFASARAGRTVRIAGNLRGHVWSRSPSFTVEGLEIGDPQWDAARPMAEVDRLSIELELWQLIRGNFVLRSVELDHPQLYLHREKSGRANWTFENTAPADSAAERPAKLPAIRDLTIDSGTLEVVDEIRHLNLKGTVVAHDSASGKESMPFQVRTKGTINSKPFKASIEGGALLGLTPGTPYPFTLAITAGSNEIEASGRVLKPFDFGALELSVKLRGQDLAELYYLTQLALPNSPPYALQAHIERNGMKVAVTDITGKYGNSDLGGRIDIDASRKRPDLKANLVSKHLFLDDFAAITGAKPDNSGQSLDEHAPKVPQTQVSRAAPAPGGRFFPDAQLQVDRLRAMDAEVSFRATAIEAGKVPFKEVSLRALLKGGQLSIEPVKFVMPQGEVTATVHIDARSATPVVHIDGRMSDIQLDQLKGKGGGAAPLAGLLEARAVVDGTGDSVHALMAAANGTFTLVVPQGEIRAALPELTGIDVPEGVLLLLGKSNDRAEVRCGVIHFNVADGVANADHMVIDTKNVLIKGSGNINLGTEALDLEIQGHPKKVRLVRLRSPIDVRGTLSAPAIRLEPGSLAKQGSVAVALGVLATPLAAILAFVDPGLAKNQNCAQLLASAQAVVDAPAPAAKSSRAPPK
jgi:AsmA family protein